MEKKDGFLKKIWTSLDDELKLSGKDLDGFRHKAKEWESLGVLKMDIRRLDERNHELLYELGLIAFTELCEKNRGQLDAQDEALVSIIQELEENRKIRAEKENQLKAHEKTPMKKES